MALKNAIFVTISIYFVFIAQTCQAIYLPEGGVEERSTNQLYSNEEQQQQQHTQPQREEQQHINHLNAKASALWQHEQQQQQEQQQLRHHKSYDKNNDVDESIAAAAAGFFNEATQSLVDNDDYTTTQSMMSTQTEEKKRKKRDLSDWLIAPNTRWCGRGNSVNGTYNYLGGASSADKCCRKHDHCEHFIPSMNLRYDIFNYRPYTISHCNCDRRFRTCLKMANDEDAKTIGKLFFNIVQTQCFVLRTDKICQKRAEDGVCEQMIVKQKGILKKNHKF